MNAEADARLTRPGFRCHASNFPISATGAVAVQCRVSETVAPFEMTLAVQPDDIDRQNHVNNTVYVRWIQEIATAHWNATAPIPARDEIGWVVLRHEIDYKSPATLGDEIILRTWVGQATRLTFERFVEVLRQGDRKLLARARTQWVPINPQTAKPTRVPTEIRDRFSI
jgi:acyl-CoA thioester hydrolase